MDCKQVYSLSSGPWYLHHQDLQGESAHYYWAVLYLECVNEVGHEYSDQGPKIFYMFYLKFMASATKVGD